MNRHGRIRKYGIFIIIGIDIYPKLIYNNCKQNDNQMNFDFSRLCD